jgi:lipopolysaccharide/colanic/teichoic acid biosynthesis glycosyltransferase
MLQTPGTPGLDAAIRQGARRRQHSYFMLARSAWPATFVACVLAFSIYILVMTAAGRTDWVNILVVAAAAALIPSIAVSLLIIEARRTHPISMSLAVVVFAACIAITTASATRVPLSYTGMLLTLPSTLFFVTFANIAMSRRLRKSVAILEFPGADVVAAKLDWPIPIVNLDNIGVGIRRVLIDPETHHSSEWSRTITKLYLRGLEIESCSSFLESSLGRVELRSFELSDIRYSPSQILYYRSKRIFDICTVLVLSMPAIIVFGVIWAYIRLVDGGPSLFIQKRRGYAGMSFDLYKFRTMYKGSHVGSATRQDSRIMPGCNFLRQFRLDELPQLYNILRGDMSFVGPRPVAIPVAEVLEQKEAAYFNRYVLYPGLTGWAQVSQGYAETTDEELEKLEFDLYYLKNVSIDLDVIILFRTITTVFFRRGSR